MRIPMVALALGVALLAGNAVADVTITATQKGKGMMGSLMSGEAASASPRR